MLIFLAKVALIFSGSYITSYEERESSLQASHGQFSILAELSVCTEEEVKQELDDDDSMVPEISSGIQPIFASQALSGAMALQNSVTHRCLLFLFFRNLRL